MSLKLFKLTMGNTEKFGVAEDAEDMYNNRAEIDPIFAFTPVVIEEVEVPGYEITVYPEGTALNPLEPPEQEEPQTEAPKKKPPSKKQS